MIYFTSDQHFGHKGIIKYCDRPFSSTHEMDKTIIDNYRDIVTEDDVIYFLGDLTLASKKYLASTWSLVQKLPGEKHLILGNHDYLGAWNYVKIGFLTVHTYLELPEYKVSLVHDPAVCQRSEKQYIVGHVHNLFKRHKNVLNVGVDVWDFKPVSLEQVSEALYGRG